MCSPSCRPKPVWRTFLCGTQKKMFWRMLLTKEFCYHWLPLTKKDTFLKISSFMFHRRKNVFECFSAKMSRLCLICRNNCRKSFINTVSHYCVCLHILTSLTTVAQAVMWVWGGTVCLFGHYSVWWFPLLLLGHAVHTVKQWILCSLYFDQINAALVRIRDFFLWKISNILSTPNFQRLCIYSKMFLIFNNASAVK